jgi:hypothetical protein
MKTDPTEKLTKEDLLNSLYFFAECLENPTHNHLEVGFRHSPLTKDEMIERYKQECYYVHQALLGLIEDIKNKGLLC